MHDPRLSRDYFLARALGLRMEQIDQIPEWLREFSITLLLGDGPEAAQ